MCKFKSVSRSFKNVGNVFRNNNLTNFVLFLTIALSVGYLVNKTYHAIVLLLCNSSITIFTM